MKKILLLATLLLTLFTSKAQNTYYWVHNDINTAVNDNTADQVNATNTGAGTAYWKHFSKVSGSTSTANLLPATINITANDNIIVDNLSLPVYAGTYNMVINTPGALICKNFDAHTFVGGPQKFRITIVTNLQVYGNLKLCPSNNFVQISGPSIEFVNNLPTNVELKLKWVGESQLATNCPCEPTNESACSEEQHQLNRSANFKVTGYKIDNNKILK